MNTLVGVYLYCSHFSLIENILTIIDALTHLKNILHLIITLLD